MCSAGSQEFYYYCSFPVLDMSCVHALTLRCYDTDEILVGRCL